MTEDLYDITVIGAGPVGLFGLYYAGLRGARIKVIDSLPQMGGQLAALYADKYIFDVPGYIKIVAKDLVEALAEQAAQFEPAICLEERVEDLKVEEDRVVMTTPKGMHYSKTAIIACGVGAFLPRKLEVQNLDDLEGRGVYYFVKDKAAFADQRVLIIGGGDTAVDWALELEHIAKSITLIHKFPVWQAHESTVKRMLNSSVDVKIQHELKAIEGSNGAKRVTIFDNRTGDTTDLEVDSVIINIGFITNLGPIQDWGLQIEQNVILVNQNMETNLPGVYGAGDIVQYPGKLKLIATGTSEAATAANNAKHRIDPKARIYPGHSTDRKDLEETLTQE
jgi:thioredoxin reductase (NADPH)